MFGVLGTVLTGTGSGNKPRGKQSSRPSGSNKKQAGTAIQSVPACYGFCCKAPDALVGMRPMTQIAVRNKDSNLVPIFVLTKSILSLLF